ncbi:PEP-CTERM sorting domain-containing protein [Nostoc sp. FACHB-87]|uniref:PEP-CTERM sorting domain-containing protein n=1 Tax=Nostocaceae TaxID=1162 RepID=UPI00168A1629|nr:MULTISPECIES: PEP-CTERM sorting domain-containing protein [Nostocaceae]MBD2452912.1 PEP-CTERM sorting domain-containing protein [Nostoc sp. FACHB-87]MBD2474906.1 PEP-CTERM sorting domain-containing protein [Anabaena sp. FACHB-83]
MKLNTIPIDLLKIGQYIFKALSFRIPINLMKHTSLLSTLLVGTSIAVVTTAARPAAAITVNFQNVFPADSAQQVNDIYVGNFSVNVTQNTASTVLFSFSNNSPASQSTAIRDVAFSVDPSISGLLSSVTPNVSNAGGYVNFNTSLPNSPQSNNIPGWDGETFGGTRVTGGQQNAGNAAAVQSGETLGFQFTANYNNVIDALINRKLQLAIHVISFPGGGSDTFYNANYNPNPQPVPEPITMLGLGVGTVGLGALKRRYGNKKAKVTV